MPTRKGRNSHTWLPDPDVAERRAKLVEYRMQGRQYQEFYEELGYASPSAASRDFNRVLEHNIAEQRASIEVYRETEILRLDAELERLDRLYTKVEKILNKHHVTIQFGKVITLDGEPIEDDSPALAAIDRLMRIDEQRRRNGERRAKLLGLDEAQRVSMEVLTIDDIERNIRLLNEQIATARNETGETPRTATADS